MTTRSWSKDDIKGKADTSHADKGKAEETKEAKLVAPPASVAMEPPERMRMQGEQRHQDALEAEGKTATKKDDEVMTVVVPTGSLVSADIALPADAVEVVKVHGLKGKHTVVEGTQAGTARVAFEQPAGPNVSVDVKRK